MRAVASLWLSVMSVGGIGSSQLNPKDNAMNIPRCHYPIYMRVVPNNTIKPLMANVILQPGDFFIAPLLVLASRLFHLLESNVTSFAGLERLKIRQVKLTYSVALQTASNLKFSFRKLLFLDININGEVTTLLSPSLSLYIQPQNIETMCFSYVLMENAIIVGRFRNVAGPALHHLSLLEMTGQSHSLETPIYAVWKLGYSIYLVVPIDKSEIKDTLDDFDFQALEQTLLPFASLRNVHFQIRIGSTDEVYPYMKMILESKLPLLHQRGLLVVKMDPDADTSEVLDRWWPGVSNQSGIGIIRHHWHE
ncbi:hypothetical protein C8J56DRAFT_879717 [Mycena floridula]|nr:hypothetical protein C8J56DRAFT_879717 [Mycena floridula]